jgi:plasmid stability protein
MATRSESRQKTELIQVRATPEEKEKLRARADAFGVSVGELCRQSIFGAKLKSRTDQEAIEELAATRADLGRLGGLLKGWLSGSFPQGIPSSNVRTDVVELLHAIQKAQACVIDAFTKMAGK